MSHSTHNAAARSRDPGASPSADIDRATLRFLSERKVCDLLAISRSTLNRRVRTDPEFPQPRRVGARTIRWIEAEVRDYISERPRAEYDDHAFDPNSEVENG